MPDLDPLGNPVGFWAAFGVLTIIVILLAMGPLFFIVSLVRARRDQPDRAKEELDAGFDRVAAEQRRLDEELKKMQARKRPPPPD